MFRLLGNSIERWWRVILVAWVAVLIVCMSVLHGWINKTGWFAWKAPSWKDVAADGEFAYLPPDMQSLVGERVLAEAFPNDLWKSSVVIVVRHVEPQLVDNDKKFIDEVLTPRLEAIKERDNGEGGKNVISNIKTFKDPQMGKLLNSDDGKATLVVINLRSEFLEWKNREAIRDIEDLLYRDLVNEIPPGVHLSMSGTATVGRDMLVAGQDSAKRTELWTTILVVGLLISIYRAPILALIPLFTVFMSVQIALALELMLTQVPYLNYRVFLGMEVYITVVVYGAGVDYCLFLIARYKEELDSGYGLRQAIPATLNNVGAALTASAGTVICGIGMMVFAQFGKFREAGIGISLSLCVVLLASLTFTPSLLRLAGRWAFWPYGRAENAQQGGWIADASLLSWVMSHLQFQLLWERVGKSLIRHPARILLCCLALMLPFAIIGFAFHDYLSYGLLSELPPQKQSVKGAKAVQEHFPAGYAGPLTVLVQNDKVNFDSPEARKSLDNVVQALQSRTDLGISDIRYLGRPLGLQFPEPTVAASDADSVAKAPLAERIKFGRKDFERKMALKHYVSDDDTKYPGHVTRIDVIFQDDPFSRESIQQLNLVERVIRDELAKTSLAGSHTHYLGPTASIRDLKTVTDQDQLKIDGLVLGGVFFILVILLRKPAISMYLILSVFFSYFVTLGVTMAVFWVFDPSFAGLDWKVPMFLFTILIAIGEDYNIFLMTRIEEEQAQHGQVEGVRVALLRTGAIISSCGIIMAGTFSSLLAGTLVGMQQLGFALAFGVLLDTFVVRPMLVPAYLILLYSGRFGGLGPLLGAESPNSKRSPDDRSQSSPYLSPDMPRSESAL